MQFNHRFPRAFGKSWSCNIIWQAIVYQFLVIYNKNSPLARDDSVKAAKEQLVQEAKRIEKRATSAIIVVIS
jgi:hypothetical protein